MWELIASFVGDLLFWREDYKFSKKVKKRRKFEEENNLPRKFMMHPVLQLLLIIFGILLVLRFTTLFFRSNFYGDNKTKEKLNKIVLLLEDEKRVVGKYPDKLTDIIRNNPLRKDIHLDYWKNEFIYKIVNDEQSFSIKSKGKDQKINTSDDIKLD